MIDNRYSGFTSVRCGKSSSGCAEGGLIECIQCEVCSQNRITIQRDLHLRKQLLLLGVYSVCICGYILKCTQVKHNILLQKCELWHPGIDDGHNIHRARALLRDSREIHTSTSNIFQLFKIADISYDAPEKHLYLKYTIYVQQRSLALIYLYYNEKYFWKIYFPSVGIFTVRGAVMLLLDMRILQTIYHI